MKYFIVGYMCCGKSTLGRPIARHLGYDYLDLDQVIEMGEGATVAEIFEGQGEEEFRSLESSYLRRIIAERDNFVLATGGGTPCFNENMELMNANGVTIYLKQSAGLLANRLLNAHVQRPLAKGKDPEQLRCFVEEHLSQREAYYSQAQIVADSPERDARRVIMALEYMQTQNNKTKA